MFSKKVDEGKKNENMRHMYHVHKNTRQRCILVYLSSYVAYKYPYVQSDTMFVINGWNCQQDKG
jgi:hypothetical protein